MGDYIRMLHDGESEQSIESVSAEKPPVTSDNAEGLNDFSFIHFPEDHPDAGNQVMQLALRDDKGTAMPKVKVSIPSSDSYWLIPKIISTLNY